MFLIKSFTFSPIQVNSYVLYNETKDCIIIDPGCYFEHERKELFSFIESEGLKPVMLINTHCHLDHVFGNKAVAEKYNLTLQAHRLEKDVLNYAPIAANMYGLPFDLYTGDIEWIEEGDVIRLGGDELKVILVPGHSPGSLCFYCEAQKFIIGGDVLFQQSIGRTDLPGGNGPQLLKNIKEKLFVLPDDVIVHPGHGPATNIGDEKRLNPFLM